VVSRDGQSAAVRVGDSTLRVTATKAAVGDRIDIGFRREHVVAHPSGAKNSDGMLTARVTASSFQGLQNEYLLDIGDGLSIRSFQPAIAAGQDDMVQASIAPENILTWAVNQ
jgi:hypothetical protein